MIKRLIFDVDNTIIIWKEKYKEAIKETLKIYNVGIDYIKVDEKIEEYENYYNVYSKENMLELINKSFNINLNMDFLDMWLDKLSNLTEFDEKVYDTLKYLDSKYELVILSNWLKENQINRLKKAKIYEFFKEVYCSENCIKPSKESFIQACGNNNLNECIMIGDSFKIDIQTPLKLGINAIFVTNGNVEKKNEIMKNIDCNNISNLQVIENVNKLKNIL